MAIDKEDILILAEAIRAKDPREMAMQQALIAARDTRRKKIEADTKKTKTHAFYRVTANGFVTGIGRVQPGQVIALPLTMKPSHTWEAVPADEDTAAAEPKPEQPKGPTASIVSQPKGPQPKGPTGKRAADEDA
jgi:hypothetical protein